MQFIYPTFLFALATLAIPILIHLFNFRRFKVVYFSNVKFLKEVKEETQSIARVKHFVVLIMRLLALLFLVLAFAQPYFPNNTNLQQAGVNKIALYIDNSFSMEAQHVNGTLLDLAKKNAIEIVSNYKPSDRFLVVTNDFEAKHQRWINRDECIEWVKEIKISANTKSSKEIISRLNDQLIQNQGGNKSVFLLTDFQKSFFNFNDEILDTTANYYLVPHIASQQNNIFIDTCWFASPVHQIGTSDELSIKITNAGTAEVENFPVKVLINNEQKALGSCSIPANGSAIIKLSYTNKNGGIQQGKIQINDFPISHDDHFYFSYELVDKVKVYAIHSKEESLALNRVYGSDFFFSLKNVLDKNVDYSELVTNNLVILNEIKSISSGLASEIKKFVEAGGTCLVIPPDDIDVQAYSSFLLLLQTQQYGTLDTTNMQVKSINFQAELYKNVFQKIPENINLPFVTAYYPITNNAIGSNELLLTLQNGNPFLTKTTAGLGKVFMLGSPINSDFTNFTQHALFVPTFYNLALYSITQANLYYTIARDKRIDISKNNAKINDVFHIKDEKEVDFIPEQRMTKFGYSIFLHNQPAVDGNYTLQMNEMTSGLSFNYDRSESNLACFSVDELKLKAEKNHWKNMSVMYAKEKGMKSLLNENKLGRQLWKYCLIMALLFFAAEALLLRFWRT